MEGFGNIRVNDISNIEYEIPNAWTIDLNYKSPSVSVVITDKNVTQLECFGHTFSIGDFTELNYGNSKSLFYISKIEKLSEYKYRIYTTKPTKAKHFILPLLGKNREFWHYTTWLINCYINSNLEEIVLEYRFNSNPKYLEFEHQLRNYTGFCGSYEQDYNTTMYFYKIPKEYLQDIKLFLDGKYSLLSEQLKTNILRFHNFNNFGMTAQILSKSNTLREQLEIQFDSPIHAEIELHDKPNSKIEIYTYE